MQDLVVLEQDPDPQVIVLQLQPPAPRFATLHSLVAYAPEADPSVIVVRDGDYSVIDDLDATPSLRLLLCW